MTSYLSEELDSKKWGEKLRELREERDWSQKDLADALGVHRQTVSDMERGVSQFTLERLNRVLEALGYRGVVQLRILDEKTEADWSPIESTDPSIRRRIRLARQFAEDLGARLYSEFEVGAVYCFGSLVEKGADKFSSESDVDLLVGGLAESRLFSAVSDLELHVVETTPEYQQFSFDLVRIEEFPMDPSGEMVPEGRAVYLPEK